MTAPEKCKFLILDGDTFGLMDEYGCVRVFEPVKFVITLHHVAAIIKAYEDLPDKKYINQYLQDHKAKTRL